MPNPWLWLLTCIAFPFLLIGVLIEFLLMSIMRGSGLCAKFFKQ
mgnify:CR=1 FL=1